MANQHSTIVILDYKEKSLASYNPLDYREGWEIVAVAMVVAWMKFLSSTTKENLMEAGISSAEVSPQWMLQALAAVVVIALGLASFCYIEGVNAAAKSVYHTLNTMTDPKNIADPIPPVYNPAAKPR
ncbi:hypothetical protein SK128_000194 [Halocaridina rubra]|uniref:Uncharacterized protein n=1 Tax=Halocaridina rubra TaxID=373956 RepID=A0AAN8WE25_HALRR